VEGGQVIDSGSYQGECAAEMLTRYQHNARVRLHQAALGSGNRTMQSFSPKTARLSFAGRQTPHSLRRACRPFRTCCPHWIGRGIIKSSSSPYIAEQLQSIKGFVFNSASAFCYFTMILSL